MAAPNRKQINWLIKISADAKAALDGLIKSGNNLTGTIKQSATQASKIYDPALIQATQQAVSDAQDAIQSNEDALNDIENQLAGIRIFPNARNQLTNILGIARRAHGLAQKARFNQLGTPEEYQQIDSTYTALVDSAKNVSDSMLELARLEQLRSTGQDTDAIRSLIKSQQEELRKAELAMADERQKFEQASKYLAAMQEGVEQAERSYVEEGIAGFVNALDEPLGSIKSGLMAIKKGEMKDAIKQFVKAGGLAKGLRAAAGKRIDNTVDLSNAEKRIGGATDLFSRLIGGLAEKAEASAGFLRGAFVAFSIVKFIMDSGDKARELNKTLMGARSLSDLGIDITAQGDPSKVSGEFTEINDRFTDILKDSDLNPYTKSKEELLAAYGELGGVYIPRATSNLNQAADTISEINRLANLNFTLQRQWGMATGELAQKEAELINEYGYSTDQVRTLYGSFEKISKNSTLPVSKLIQASSSLAMQSPVFGTTLSQTAVMYQRLYDLKVFGTKELNTYLQNLSSMFQDKGTASKALAHIVTMSKEHAALASRVFGKEIAMADKRKDPQAGIRARILKSAQQSLEKVKRGEGLNIDEQQALYSATNLLGLQSKRALAGLALFSDDQLKSKGPLKLNSRDLENILRSSGILGMSKDTVPALIADLNATLSKNPNMTLRDALMDIKDVQKEQADSAMKEVEDLMTKTKGAFQPPLQGLRNFADSLMGKFYELMNGISTMLQRFLFSPMFKAISSTLGLGTPGEDLKVGADLANAMDAVYKAKEEAEKVLKEKNSTSNEKKTAKGDLDEALGDLGNIMKRTTEGKVQGRRLLTENSLSFSQYIQLTGTSIDPKVLNNFPEELRNSVAPFLTGRGATTVNQTVQAKIPNLDVPVIKDTVAKPGKTRSFQLKGGATLNITNKWGLSKPDQDKLDFLAKNPTDPRATLLAVLQSKYQGSPIFAVILKKFLENLDTGTDPAQTLSKLNEAWIGSLSSGIEDVYKGEDPKNKTTITGELNSIKSGLQTLILGYKPTVPSGSSNGTITPTVSPPAAIPSPSGGEPAATTPSVVTPKIEYAVKYVKLNVTTLGTVDLASVVSELLQSAGEEIVKRAPPPAKSKAPPGGPPKGSK